MNYFKPGDKAHYAFPNGDKALCKVIDVLDDDRLRIEWQADEFVNIMPKERFVKDE